MFRLILVFVFFVSKYCYPMGPVEFEPAITQSANEKQEIKKEVSKTNKKTEDTKASIARIMNEKFGITEKECLDNAEVTSSFINDSNNNLGQGECTLSPGGSYTKNGQAECARMAIAASAQCKAYKSVDTSSKVGKITSGIIDNALNQLGSTVVSKLTGERGDCLNTCRNQIQAGRGFIQGLAPNISSFADFFNKTGGAEKEMLKQCLCSSSCYFGAEVTKETCDILLGNKADCKEFKRGGKYASGMSDAELLLAKADCECQQTSQTTGLEFKLDNKGACIRVVETPESADQASEFGSAGGPDFTGGEGKPEDADEKEKAKDAAAAAASGGGSGASGKASSFSKDNKWKSPYRKNDGIYRAQDAYGRGGFNQKGSYSSLKPTKDESKFIPKSETASKKPKDIFEAKDSIFDEISKTYEDGVTANAFMYLANSAKNSAKNNKIDASKKNKKVKRHK